MNGCSLGSKLLLLAVIVLGALHPAADTTRQNLMEVASTRLGGRYDKLVHDAIIHQFPLKYTVKM